MIDEMSASDLLLYDYRFLEPTRPSGFWLCDTVEDVQAVEINAGCLKAGASWDDLVKHEDFFRQFPYVLIVCADPKRREVIVREARVRLQSTTFLVADDAGFRGCSSVRQLRDNYGLPAVDRILMYAHELPCFGLLNLADVRQPDMSNLPRVLSGISDLDRLIGGFFPGELSVWTGKRGEGKSTLIDQLLLEAIDQGTPVCAYSGELQDWKFKYWATLQAAGPRYIIDIKDRITGKKMPSVSDAVQQRIDRWWNRRFLIYDIGTNTSHSAEDILRTFEYAHRCYGAGVFLVDNLMTAKFRGRVKDDYYLAQSEFVGRLASFARGAKVHVHLVAHPKKSDRGINDPDDVSGSGDVTNYADNVFSVRRRVRETDAAGNPVGSPGAELIVFKNRFLGAGKRGYKLDFDEWSKRFCRAGGTPDKAYGWEYDGEGQMAIADDSAEPDPFQEKPKKSK